MPRSLCDSFLSAAFDAIAVGAIPADHRFVSLYVAVPYYGGPEEGGWWGEDCMLVKSQRCATIEEAEALRDRVQSLADEMSEQARHADDLAMLKSCEWLEARNLDADFFPEPDGPERYYVAIEETAGSHESRGCRHYE